jgi:hypothetical protein
MGAYAISKIEKFVRGEELPDEVAAEDYDRMT